MFFIITWIGNSQGLMKSRRMVKMAIMNQFMNDHRINDWPREMENFLDHCVYRTVPLPKTQDVIAWDRLPNWAEWVARDKFDDFVSCYENEPHQEYNWWAVDTIRARRIDDFPGIVQIGTVDWKDSKQRRPR
jgi:hypothetical protein